MAAKAKLSQGELVERCLIRSPGGAPLIDIGVNLVDDAYDKGPLASPPPTPARPTCARQDRSEVLERAKRAGVAAIIVTGCTVRSAQAAQRLCDSASTPELQLFFTAGVHPHNAKDADDATLGELRRLAAHPRCVAIGECGLDFNRNFSAPDVQERVFAAQAALAVEVGKPLFMHCRDAGQRFAEILRGVEGLSAAVRAPGTAAGAGGAADAHPAATSGAAPTPPPRPPGVLHCFTGSAHELEQCLDLGLAIGITGWVCDERPERGGAELAALLPSIPRSRLMIETDAPYLTPRSIMPAKARPHRNEPALLPHVLARVAGALGQQPEEVAAHTTAAAVELFDLQLFGLHGGGSGACAVPGAAGIPKPAALGSG